jgi:hypothetical protein
MTDDTCGMLHQLLHVRPPSDVAIPQFEPKLYPRLLGSVEHSAGANLRFKHQNWHQPGALLAADRQRLTQI